MSDLGFLESGRERKVEGKCIILTIRASLLYFIILFVLRAHRVTCKMQPIMAASNSFSFVFSRREPFPVASSRLSVLAIPQSSTHVYSFAWQAVHYNKNIQSIVPNRKKFESDTDGHNGNTERTYRRFQLKINVSKKCHNAKFDLFVSLFSDQKT